LREEKKERKLKERLDFEFPSETARRESKSKGKEKEKEQGDQDERFRVNRVEGEDDEYRDKSWNDHGHINFFQDIEQNVSPTWYDLTDSSRRNLGHQL
jgi:hypothetical protein